MAGGAEAHETGGLGKPGPGGITMRQMFAILSRVMGDEKDFYLLAIIYGIGISLLSLATPISVQMLINTVANIGLAAPLIILAATLFILLAASGLLNALRIHLMEIFSRRFYARMVSEISLKAIYAQNPFFHDDGRQTLFNRYFDIVTVQKNVPLMLIGGFTVILQAGVGFVLVSLYHPLFLVFNIVLTALIWVIWQVWGPGAVRSAIALSYRKHEAAGWLQGLAASNGFFKSDRLIDYALDRTDQATAGYVNEHRAHFRQYFSQTVSFFLLYAAASATLLGLGGWLVIQGQLSIGQLVAAELVLSAAFFGMSQLGTYLNYFYEFCAAVEELSLFDTIAQEEPKGATPPPAKGGAVRFDDVRGDARGREAVLNFEIASGATIMGVAANHGVQRLLTNLLKRHISPRGGVLSLGGGDILDTEVHALRREVIVLDRSSIVEMTIREYLSLSAEEESEVSALEALRIVGLEAAVASLEDGLDTKLAVSGWPLSIVETMQLKLAGAIISRPRVLVMNQLFDLVPESCLRAAVAHLATDELVTVIYFSNRRRDLGFDGYLYLGTQSQSVFESYDEFDRAVYGGPEPLRLTKAVDPSTAEPAAVDQRAIACDDADPAQVDARSRGAPVTTKG